MAYLGHHSMPMFRTVLVHSDVLAQWIFVDYMTFLSLILKSREDMTGTHEKLNSNGIYKPYFYKTNVVIYIDFLWHALKFLDS